MNFLIKVIRTAGAINFIIRTEDECDYWVWQVSDADWFDYFGDDQITEDRAATFINDADNDTLGCSGGSYDTVEDAVADLER